MIPLKLQIKNFLSYGPEIQTVDFSAYPLICLSGKNGHGKSALLDAITWALWGQARKPFGVAKADESLVHLGQAQMFVVLDFIFNEQTYRVRREFIKSYGKTITNVDFGIIDADTNSFIALTDKTSKRTQEKIEQMLNLDMESFVNSAFLRQGQANEFSKKSAKDRKKILATILGLNRYESLRTLAHEKMKVLNNEKTIKITLQEKREQELAKKTDLMHKLHEQELALQTIMTQEQQLSAQQKEIAQKQKNIAEQEQQFMLVSYQHDSLLKKQSELIAHLVETRKLWKTAHKQLLSIAGKELLEQKQKAAINQIQLYQEQFHKSLTIQSQILTLTQQHNQQKNELTAHHATHVQTKKLAIEQLLFEQKNHATLIHETDISYQEHEKQRTTLEHEHTMLDSAIKGYRAQTPHSERIKKQFEKRREAYQSFITQGNYIQQELAQLKQKQKMVHDKDNPSCPLCEQNLSASRKRFLNDTFCTTETFLTHRLTRLTHVIARLKKLLVEQHTHIEQIKKQTEEYHRSVTKQEELNKTMIALAGTITAKKEQLTTHAQHKIVIMHRITTAQAEYETIKQMALHNLEHDALIKVTSQRITALEKEYATIEYKDSEHKQVQMALKEIEHALAQYAQIAEQKPLQQQRAITITTVCASLKSIKKEITSLHHTLQQFHNLTAQVHAIAQAATTIANQQKNLLHQKEVILQEKGSLLNQKNKLEQLESESHQEQTDIQTLTATIDDYYTIATAIGKDGIQALLIEEAIPEIEEEANQLLGRLTNNQSHIIIESVRDLKSGGTRETLDIKISDAIGIRPYELFSGGEAFRIDFSLRIAISKLLARRAGTSLQTLIIDEGFGSQDEEGLNNIMEALYKIQDDFSKIIIVSHLASMKDQFPVHFLVEKTAQGSLVSVMEQG
ncbi:MAG TPA: SMC family ATPase [Candidatus Babeliales bacterium]|nr:SMC family ATPase [Candidatus Babeliales bacterium]